MVYISARPYGGKSDERKLLILKEFLGSVGFQGGGGGVNRLADRQI